MNPAVQAVVCGHHRAQVTQTFTANASWTAPITTSRVDTAVGKGANGSAAYDTTVQQYVRTTTVYQYFANTNTSSSSVTDVRTFSGEPGVDYCEEKLLLPNGNTTQTCYSYEDTSYTVHTDATTGADTTAFSQTFPGGVGGLAPTTTKTNLIVTPGATYSFVIPAGGSLTITYYQ